MSRSLLRNTDRFFFFFLTLPFYLEITLGFVLFFKLSLIDHPFVYMWDFSGGKEVVFLRSLLRLFGVGRGLFR